MNHRLNDAMSTRSGSRPSRVQRLILAALLVFVAGCTLPAIKLPFGLDGLKLGQTKSEVQLSRPRSRAGDSCWCTGEELGGDCLVEELDPRDLFASTVLYCFSWGRLVEIKTSQAGARSAGALPPEQAIAGAVAGARNLWGEPNRVFVSGLAAGNEKAYTTSAHAVWFFPGSELVLSYTLPSTTPGPLDSAGPGISVAYARGRRGTQGLQAQRATADPALLGPLLAAWPAPTSVVQPMLR
jgi:hypothetical protein